MDVGFQRLELFLVRDAEMLLLVDDEETKILEVYGFGEQCMGSDDDVDSAFGELRACHRGLLGVDEARELAHLERKAGEAFAEVAEMLAREQRRRHDDGDLLP